MHITDPFNANETRQNTPLTQDEILTILADISGSAMRIHAQVSAPVSEAFQTTDPVAAKASRPLQL